MPLRIERTRFGPVYLVFTWAFGLVSWGFVYEIVGINIPSLERFFLANQLPSVIVLFLVVVCAFVRQDPAEAREQWSEDALTLFVVLVYAQEVAVALMGFAAMLVVLSQLASRRLRTLERGPWYTYA